MVLIGRHSKGTFGRKKICLVFCFFATGASQKLICICNFTLHFIAAVYKDVGFKHGTKTIFKRGEKYRVGNEVTYNIIINIIHM